MITAASLYDRLKTVFGEELSDQVIREKAGIALEIIRLKQEKNALLLVHNYADPALFHTVADITGDSLELSRRASESDKDIILVCGVSFMAETAKLLNPEKKVLLPVEEAGCSLAQSITVDDVRELKRLYPGVPLVAYINTNADLKAEIDICCTSGNAEQILASFPDGRVIFLPDEFLGTNVSRALGRTITFPGDGADGDVIGWRGRCEVHERFSIAQLEGIRESHPEAVVLAHPECSPDIVSAADFTGGTATMINHIRESDATEFCLFSEAAMEKNITLDDPRKRFIPVPYYRCPHMERVTLENTLEALREERYEIDLPEKTVAAAADSVRRMLQFSAKG